MPISACPLWRLSSPCSGTEKQPKHKVLGQDIPRTSGRISGQTSRPKNFHPISLGCTPKGAYGNTAFWEGFWEVSGKGSGEGVLRRVLRRGSSMGFTVKRVLRRVLRRGSEKGVSRRCLERPLVEYAPLGVRPILGAQENKMFCADVLAPQARTSTTREASETLCSQTSGWFLFSIGCTRRGSYSAKGRVSAF